MAHLPGIPRFSTKRLQISKENTSTVIVASITAFLIVFVLVASRTLLAQKSYNTRVITAKQDTRDLLVENDKSATKLFEEYKKFAEQPVNILKGDGSGKGVGERDGDNPKIVLDALPSKYDAPAVATSLEKILTDRNFNIKSLQVTDDELAQSSNVSASDPTPIEIPFSLSVNGSYNSIQDLVKVLEASIRPLRIKSVQFSGADSSMTIDVQAVTYYQPQKQFTIGKKPIK